MKAMKSRNIQIFGLSLLVALVSIAVTLLLTAAKSGREIRSFLIESPVDLDQGWYPHQLGNYWINRDFIPCDPHNMTWYWEVVEVRPTDSANFFLVEKYLNPCDSTENKTYREWFAYTNDHKLYMVNDKFEYYDLEADFGLEEGQSFIRQGLRYTLIKRTENKMVFEYDLYHDDTYTFRFEKGIGRDLAWEEVQIAGVKYGKDKYRQWNRLEK